MLSRWLTLFRSPAAYCSLYFLAFVLVILLGLALAPQGIELNQLPMRAYNTYECVVGGQKGIAGETLEGARTFRIMDVFHLGASSVADSLCGNSEFAEAYDRVVVAWVNRDQIDLRQLFQKHYDLLIAKPQTMERTDMPGISGYMPIAHYANYSGLLIAFESQPEMSNAYFQGKKLGLLDDPNSLSGYQIPNSALKRANIDFSLFDIAYYKSHLELYSALHRGEVDLIASFRWSEFDGSSEPSAEKVLRLQSELPGPRWYLHPERVDTVSHCVVQEALKEIARVNEKTYLEDITIVRLCVRWSII